MKGKKSDYTKAPGGGMTPMISDRDGAPSTDPMSPQQYLPEIQPAIRGPAENAGFPRETLEGQALLVGPYGLRDGNNEQSDGTNPDYPMDMMDKFGSGEDLRPGRS